MAESFRLFLIDETNLDANEHQKWFIVACLNVQIDKAPLLHQGVDKVRKRFDFKPEDPLKFQSKSRPSQLSVAEFAEAKQEILELCARLDTKLSAVIVPHGVIAKTESGEIDQEKKFKYQYNDLLKAANSGLTANGEWGEVIYDRQPFHRPQNYAADAFLEFDRLLMHSVTGDQLSRISSAADIAIGTLGYCINQRRPGSETIARKLFHLLVPLFDSADVGDISKTITVNPQEPKQTRYQNMHSTIAEHWSTLAEASVTA